MNYNNFCYDDILERLQIYVDMKLGSVDKDPSKFSPEMI
jgi:hypothetical protein